ncbi:nuclear transport factor 2 family protein [uncultured Brevundimonas sp.]|uniref:YybH family protein n=1 Tax=uncultured Brevundimonas sp. TaxID=213418 RepID=UPI0030EC9685|tara:strand:+ start:7676 stop:8173 length:498 start_codon:yes stop_codon:yes gene_type:complete
MIRLALAIPAALVLLITPAAAAIVAHDPAPAAATGDDIEAGAVAAAAVVDAFHAALEHGDTAAALTLLSDDVLIFEEGGAERSKAEYTASHLAADAAFSAAVPAVRTRRSGRSGPDLAWISSENRTTGVYRERAIDRIGTETMVLRLTPAGWRIVHIHWSSRAAS